MSVSNSSSTTTTHCPLRVSVSNAINYYFEQLGEMSPSNLYKMILAEVEMALFNSVLQHAAGNQTQAAAILGINRSTLRKKLREYQIDVASSATAAITDDCNN